MCGERLEDIFIDVVDVKPKAKHKASVVMDNTADIVNNRKEVEAALKETTLKETMQFRVFINRGVVGMVTVGVMHTLSGLQRIHTLYGTDAETTRISNTIEHLKGTINEILEKCSLSEFVSMCARNGSRNYPWYSDKADHRDVRFVRIAMEKGWLSKHEYEMVFGDVDPSVLKKGEVLAIVDYVKRRIKRSGWR